MGGVSQELLRMVTLGRLLFIIIMQLSMLRQYGDGGGFDLAGSNSQPWGRLTESQAHLLMYV